MPCVAHVTPRRQSPTLAAVGHAGWAPQLAGVTPSKQLQSMRVRLRATGTVRVEARARALVQVRVQVRVLVRVPVWLKLQLRFRLQFRLWFRLQIRLRPSLGIFLSRYLHFLHVSCADSLVRSSRIVNMGMQS